MKEADIQRSIQIAMSAMGHRVFRNQVGEYRVGNRYISYGLCVGSSDLIGWTNDGKFLAIEVKRPGKKPTAQQKLFIDTVNSYGGIGIVATSVESAVSQMERLAKWQQI